MSLRARLRETTALAGAALLWGVLATPSASQEAPILAGPEAQAQQETPGAAELDEIVVTGTRIRVPDYEGSAPVASVSGEALVNAGVTNVTDFLTDQPALVSSTTLADNSTAGNRGSVGLNLLNLRNLGSQRTLTLVNGRRHVAAQPGSQGVDINTIPVALIGRVDILTGGASAIYGADGVSGAVNFILKDDFEGLDVRTQAGWSEEGGGENTFVSVLAGRNLLDGAANFTLGAEFSATDRLGAQDREFSSLGGRETLVSNPRYGEPGEYQQVFVRNARYIDTAPGGAVYTDTDFRDSIAGVDFNGDGTPWRDGVPTSGFMMIGGDGSQLAAFATDLIPELDRFSLNSTFNVEITPTATFFGELKWVNTQTQFQSQPSFDYGLHIAIDNPFMPEAIRDAAMAPGGTYWDYGGVLMGRDNFDLGFITRDVERNTYRAVLGFRGDLGDSLSYEASLNYGRTDERNTEGNNRIHERFFAAIDAVDEGEFLTGVANGNIVCRSDLDPTAIPLGDLFSGGFDASTWGTTFTPGPNSGCQPLNIFGDGVGAPAAADWILTDSTTLNSVEQVVLNAFLSGNTERFLELPGGAASFVLGAEYRREEASSRPSLLEVEGARVGSDITWLGQASPLAGAIEVKEVFGEIYLPLLRDLPFVENLTLNGAYRYSSYSTVGQTEAWNLGVRWDLNDSIGVRSSVARAVRAPNISELFLPRSQTFALIRDPCDDDNYQAGDNPAVREANCRAMLGLGPNDPYTFNNTSSSSVEGVIGGNKDLKSEEADTFTAGLVLRPSIVPGLSLSLDYYDVELQDAIQFFSANVIADKCYDLPQPNQFCDLITRDATTRFIDSFEQIGVNVASYRTRGYDLTLRHVLDPADFGMRRDIGRFGLSVTASKLEQLTFTEDPGNPLSVDEQVGQNLVPEWQTNVDASWEWRGLLVSYGYNWFDETERYVGRPDDWIDPEYVNYSARSTHDLQVRYRFDDRASIYGGVNNIGNQQPDRGEIDYPVSPQGRYFYLGLNMSL